MIFKKLFLLFTLLFSTISAEDIPTLEILAYNGGSTLNLQATQAPQAWIGIFKKDTSTIWDNVLTWEWVTEGITSLSLEAFQEGDYEARLFFNNSFDVEKKVDFHYNSGPSQFYNRIKNTTIQIRSSREFSINYKDRGISSVTDWVGVFKPNKEHTRENLLAWGYIVIPNFPQNHMGTVPLTTINGELLKVGQYEMVFFSNNSYKQLGNVVTLTVDFIAKYASGIYKTLGYVLDSDDYINIVQQEKDWIAIFKKDDEPIRENIIAWSYTSEGIFPRDDAKDSIIQFPKLEGIFEAFEGGAYKVILFKQDTYQILKTMIPVSV